MTYHEPGARGSRWAAIIVNLVAVSLLIGACGAGDDAVAPTSTAPAAAPLPSSSGDNVASDAPAAVTVAGNQITIPPGWYSAAVDLPDGSSLLFVRQDPAMLAAFDDPVLAVPADFAGGALIVTPLPEGADAAALENEMAASLSQLGDQDFEAMLSGADQAGLINLAAVDRGRLQVASIDTVGRRSAILLEGTVHFLDEQPPVLRGKIWLSWNRESFVVLYALAAETLWPSVSAEFDGARRSLRLP